MATMETYGPAAERAIRRVLRDIADGHITLTVNVARFDPHTGQPIDPVVGWTVADRAVSLMVPNAAGEWWQLFAERGWIRLPEAHEASMWHVTALGREILAQES